MLLPLVVASGATLLSLSLALYVTYLLALNGPDIYIARLALSVVIAYGLAKLSTFGYRAISLPAMPQALRVSSLVFATSAAFTVAGLLYSGGQLRIALTPTEFENGVYALYAGAWLLLGYESYKMFSGISDVLLRLLIGAIVFSLILGVAVVLLLVAIDLANRNMNAIYASAVAAWAGTLTSSAIGNLRADPIVESTFGNLIESWLKRDGLTIVATAVAFAAFKLNQQWPPIVFPIVVGALAGIFGCFFAGVTSDT